MAEVGVTRHMDMYEKLMLAREARELGRKLRAGKPLGFRHGVGRPYADPRFRGLGR